MFNENLKNTFHVRLCASGIIWAHAVCHTLATSLPAGNINIIFGRKRLDRF